jgi:hypothetical protein
MHVHFVNHSTSPQTLGPRIDRALAALNVAAGVTSAMSLCGVARHLAWRDSIARGAALGPRLAVSDLCINDSTMSRAGGDSLARREHAAGFDFLKVYSFLSREGFEGLADAARQVGMPIIGHIPRRVGLAGMLNARVADIAHVEELMYAAPFRLDYGSVAGDAVQLDPSAIPGVVGALRAAGTYVTTTLVAYQAILDEAVDLDAVLARPCSQRVPPKAREFFEWDREHNDRVRRLGEPIPLSQLRLGWSFQLQLTKALADGGVPLLAGTDGPSIPGVGSGCALHQELQLLVLAGLTPYQALRTATVLPGEFFAREFHWPPSGTIAVGARADLVLLDANPLVDIHNTMSIDGVVLNGAWASARRLREVARSLAEGLQ